jgi:hypothetical protein
MNGCKYTITASQTAALTANVHINGCTSGRLIEVESAGCLVTVPEQGGANGLAHMTFANKQEIHNPGQQIEVKTPEHVEVNITVQGIQYTVHNLGGCLAQTGQKSNGDYTGTATFKAYEDTKTTKQVTHEGHQFEQLICGAQKGLFAT